MGKIADLFVKLGLKNDEFNKELNESKKKVSFFSKQVKKIGGLIAGAFAVQKLWEFTKDIVRLTAQAEGVERAFKRIGGEDYFAEIKEATKGTVSNLELMRKTVSAQQLGVPVQQLGKLFEFATQRAADTGESVDFLVNSIVVGIGRKSPLILDNLGISAIALKEKLGDVGMQTASVGDVAKAVGAIASEEMQKIGDTAATTAQRMQQMTAEWENLKVSIGKSGIVEYFGGILKEINRLIWQTSTDDFQKALDPILGDIAIEGKTPEKRIAAINAQIEAQIRLRDQLISKEAKFANTRSKAFKDEKGFFDPELVKKWAAERLKGNNDFQISLKVTKRLQEELEKSSKKTVKTDEQKADTINSIKAEIEVLQKTQGDASGKNLENINKEIESLNNYLNLLKKVGTTEKEKPRLKTEADLPVLETSPLVGAGINKTSQAGALGGLDEVFEKTQKKQEEFISNQRAFNEQAAGLATDFITDTVVTFAEGIGQMFAGDFNIEDFGKALLQAVGNFLSMLGKMMIQFGVTALIYATLAKALSNPATAGPAAVAMIAAGAALVAIGSAIGSAASGGSSAGGTGAITTIDTRGASTPSTSNSLRQTEVQPVTVQVEGNISNKTIALSNNLGQKDIRR